MPKPVLFEPRPGKKKRKKRKIDYTPLLYAAVVPDTQCPHTKKPLDASTCSQCMLVSPSVVHKPITRDWWHDDPEIEISLEEIAGKMVIVLDGDLALNSEDD